MPTEKPSVITYVDPGLYEQLVSVKEERGARSLSQTVEEILKEYVSGSLSSNISSTIFIEQNRQLIQQVNGLIKSHQSLQELVMDLQSMILATISGSMPNSAHIEFLTQKARSRQITQQFTQENSENRKSKKKEKDESYINKLTPEVIKDGLTGTQLADRLNIHSSILSRRRSKPDFSEWSQKLDPNRVAWKYIGFSRRFYPTEFINTKGESLGLNLGG